VLERVIQNEWTGIIDEGRGWTSEDGMRDPWAYTGPGGLNWANRSALSCSEREFRIPRLGPSIGTKWLIATKTQYLAEKVLSEFPKAPHPRFWGYGRPCLQFWTKKTRWGAGDGRMPYPPKRHSHRGGRERLVRIDNNRPSPLNNWPLQPISHLTSAG